MMRSQKRPGYTVTKTIEDGHEVVRIRKETVVITIDSKGMMGIDRSDAVLCFWDLYVNLKEVQTIASQTVSPN